MMSGRCYPDSERIRHFVADDDAGLDGEHRYVEVRYHEDPDDDPVSATIDEICTTQVHLEQMDDDSYWMSVCGVHVWFTASRQKGTRKLRIDVTCFPNTAQPHVVKPGEGTLENYSRPTQAEGEDA